MNSASAFQDLDSQDTVASDQALYNINGVILRPHKPLSQKLDMRDVALSINNGQFKGFVRLDGRFTISSVPNGSHILEVHHPDFYFEPVKVEINGKGKYRARKVSYTQPSVINQVPYPLRLQPLFRRNYFRLREQWRLMDILLNPLVLSMLVPMLFMLILPKIISDPEAKKELDNMPFPKIKDIPDFGDMLSSYLSGTAKPGQREIAERPRKKAQ
ncbi:ER membrane protein complex subunit 7 homolog [Drosophila kikkawai]|uniref:ER membrane protein complex subunit 7 homolog n=1 Tax=Drosophila kikkawai TaxID=30033 RepID=A0A6P4IU94_DROKI|nr:ER membrane protein complex subunit 7 homolog [Drosophila kikkawai]